MADEKKPAEKPTAGHTFSHTIEKDGKKVTKTYKTKIPVVRIPHLNDGEPITSLEISKDPEVQKHLVDVKSQAIEEVPGDVVAE